MKKKAETRRCLRPSGYRVMVVGAFLQDLAGLAPLVKQGIYVSAPGIIVPDCTPHLAKAGLLGWCG